MYSESGGPVRQVDNFGECLLVSISYHIAVVNQRSGACWRMHNAGK